MGHVWLVYLTWKTKLSRGSNPPAHPTLGLPTILMFLSLYDVNFCLTIRHLRASVEDALKSQIVLRADPQSVWH
jgi:hypothetical protein